ncbi:MAG: NUDIX domain-containing protein, partial [Candidatus Bipolaricaulota bacterium]
MNISGEEENLDGETLEENQIFQGKLLGLTINTVRDSDGSVTTREVVHHPGGVVILPILNGDQGEEILLVKQYREPAGEALWELPAGTLEEGESQRECARRELMEETRYRPAELEKKVNLFTSPGYSNEILALYRATGLEKISDSEAVES